MPSEEIAIKMSSYTLYSCDVGVDGGGNGYRTARSDANICRLLLGAAGVSFDEKTIPESDWYSKYYLTFKIHSFRPSFLLSCPPSFFRFAFFLCSSVFFVVFFFLHIFLLFFDVFHSIQIYSRFNTFADSNHINNSQCHY